MVRIEAGGVCHSDLSVVDGNRVRPLLMLLGHEAAGLVERVGDGVDDLAEPILPDLGSRRESLKIMAYHIGSPGGTTGYAKVADLGWGHLGLIASTDGAARERAGGVVAPTGSLRVALASPAAASTRSTGWPIAVSTAPTVKSAGEVPLILLQQFRGNLDY
jgi:NADPH:quinone reductase-like Zn-dependent oxidoreductase